MRLRRALRRFGTSRRAVAALEFALVFPMLMMLYVGAAQVSDVVTTARKLSSVAYMLSDIIAQEPATDQAASTPLPATAVPSAVLDAMITGAQAVMYPGPASKLIVTISAIDLVKTGAGTCCTATVRWSYSNGNQLRPCGTPLTTSTASNLSLTQIPQGLIQNGLTLVHPLYYVAVDVSYAYTPLVATTLPIWPTMQRSVFLRPRNIGQVILMNVPSGGSNTSQVCY